MLVESIAGGLVSGPKQAALSDPAVEQSSSTEASKIFIADTSNSNLADAGRRISDAPQTGLTLQPVAPKPLGEAAIQKLLRVADGGFIGAEGRAYPPTATLPGGWSGGKSSPAISSSRHVIAPVLPTDGKTPREDIILVNGMMEDPILSHSRAQYLANAADGARVIVLHNKTDGLGGDLAQVEGDDLSPRENAATRSLAGVVYNALRADRELHLVGHSQGAMVISNAVKLAGEQLREVDELGEEQVTAKLARLKIETHAGSASSFPDGPQYVHYANMLDAVPNILGTASVLQSLNPLIQAGEGAVIRRFSEMHLPKVHPNVPEHSNKGFGPKVSRAIDGAFHGVEGIYFDQRVSFDEARVDQETSLMSQLANFLLSLFWLPLNLLVEIMQFLAKLLYDAFRDEQEEAQEYPVPAFDEQSVSVAA